MVFENVLGAEKSSISVESIYSFEESVVLLAVQK
jgi:hypothetical protein